MIRFCRSLLSRYGPGVLTALVLAATTVGVYWQALTADFVNYDDNTYIYWNPHVLGGLTWDDMRWAATTTEVVNWHPLTWLSFQLDQQLYHDLPNPAHGFHRTNVILHTANTILLLWLLTRMTERLWRSAFVAALFALHPLHVESAAWVAERKDVLSALFWMLTTAAYVLYAERPHWLRYLPVVLFFALGLMAKSMLVTLPFVLFLLDFWPLRRFPGMADPEGPPPYRTSWVRIVVEKVPLLALSAASAAVTMYAQRLGGEVNPAGEMPLRIENALASYVTYIGKTVWPVNLICFYPMPREVNVVYAVEAGLLLAAVTLLTLALARCRPYLLVGWLWFLGTLAPVIGVIQVIGGQGMADRYTYIPLIGLFIALVWGVADGLARAGVRPWVPALAGAVLLAGCTIGTWQQVGFWHDSLTLWRHTLDVDPKNHLAFNNIGTELFGAKEYNEAAACFAKAVEYAPADHYLGNLARNNYAKSLEQLREPAVAIAEYAEVAHTPTNRDAQYQLGMKLVELGKMAEAVPPLEAACRIDPNYAPPHVYLGWVYYRERKLSEAVAEYEAALRIEPSALAHYCLGLALEARLDVPAAEAEYEAALRLDPKYDAARTRLAVLR